jgi:hypothetical protein
MHPSVSFFTEFTARLTERESESEPTDVRLR